MRKFWILSRVLLAAALTAGLSSCAAKQPAKVAPGAVENMAYEDIPTLNNDQAVVYKDVTPDFVLTYAENQTEDYPTTQAGYRFAQLVNLRSRGKIQVRLHADAVLGDEASTVKQLRIGGIDLVRVSMSTVVGYHPESTVLMLPYIYRDSEHMWNVLDGEIGREVADGFTGMGFTPLAYFDAGVRNFYFRAPVHSAEELQGLQIRVQPSGLMQDMVKSLGASPVVVAYENVYAALDKGTVDGAENNWSSYVAMRHYETAPYFVEDEHVRVPEMLLLSDVARGKLGEDHMKVIAQSAADAGHYERYLWKIYEEKSRQRALNQGVTVISLSEEEKGKFRDAVSPLYEKYCGDYMDLVNQIEQTP
jgi:tripartite ATP-independent transporter DctP family solute receptor